LRNLTELYLDRTQIGIEGLEVLCRSEVLCTVEKLILPHNGLDDRAIEIIADSDCLPNLVTLDLYKNRLSAEAAQVIKQSPKLKKFKFLQVD